MASEPMKSNSLRYEPNDAETYDEWFVRQVEEGLKVADDPRTVWTSSEEVFNRVDERLQSSMKRMALKKAS